MLINEENKIRSKNDLAELIIPSESTLRRHRDELLSPTEYLLATKGERFARNKRGRGSTDVRALFIGEMVEIDECKVSLIASAKARGYWASYSEDLKTAMKWADEEIRFRFTILVMLDVATRMPLAWVISEQPKAEATLELLRMGTRDKTREKRVYECEGDPVPACGLGMIRNDNGVGLRNKKVKQALLGTGAASTDVRAFASADKPYVERMFGTTESILWKLVHGYTGRKPGELPAYNAKSNGVLDIDQLYKLLTQFMIDEYPSLRHMGVGMGTRRPLEVFHQLNETRGFFREVEDDQRRVHLGWKFELKPNDEGVKVLSGLWYSSDLFQAACERWKGKVTIFVDPDNLSEATAIVPFHKGLLKLDLQTTIFADLTVAEYLTVLEEYRHEDPASTTIYEDRIARVRRKRYDALTKIGVERRLARSYTTVNEAVKKAKTLLAGSRIVSTDTNLNTVKPGSLTAQNVGPAVFQLGGGTVIDHVEVPEESPALAALNDGSESVLDGGVATKPSGNNKTIRLGRPEQKGTFK